MSKQGYAPDCHVVFSICCKLFAKKKAYKREGGQGQPTTPLATLLIKGDAQYTKSIYACTIVSFYCVKSIVLLCKG